MLHNYRAEFETINLTGKKEPEIHLSSVCAVFAQSEIVELISKSSRGGGNNRRSYLANIKKSYALNRKSEWG